jgi:hypothetical protein
MTARRRRGGRLRRSTKSVVCCALCLRLKVPVTHRLATADQVAEAEEVLGRALPPAVQPERGHGLCSSCGNALFDLSVNVLFAAALVSAPAPAPSHCVVTVSGVCALASRAVSAGLELLAAPSVRFAICHFCTTRTTWSSLRVSLF